MAYEQKPNSGSLFRNEDKKTDKHPDYSGSAVIGGVEYWVNGWINTIGSGENKGKKYMNLQFKPKDQQSGQPSQGGQTADPRDDVF